MWQDNETELDFLNFSAVAEAVAGIIVQAEGRPVSIGVSGAWGAGKSSMIKLIRKGLEKRSKESKEFVFVEFNAWLYQGYDDVRAALLEVIARALEMEAQERKKGLEKAKDLVSRVNWIRYVNLAKNLGFLALATGFPEMTYPLGVSLLAGKKEKTEQKTGTDSSPPKQIHEIRSSFERTLKEMDIKLVVLIDDLDRCLPATTISTLEALRVFLFLENTAFVVAADDAMIKNAVRSRFEGVDEALATNYFDKLIQVPIRVPQLGTQEVRAYLMLLFVDDSTLPKSEKDAIRSQVCEQLTKTWRGCRVDRAFMDGLQIDFPPDLVSRFDTADRLAPIMTTASQIAGNPRLIKRFLNALSIRMSISKAHGVGVDEAVLAKMLLFERCARPAVYDRLAKAVNDDSEGKPRFLANWEENIQEGNEPELEGAWEDPFISEWLAIPPHLADVDLRGVLYVSRENIPLITPGDRLSSEAAEVLAAILKYPEGAEEMHEQLESLPHHEMTIVMDQLLVKARGEQEWGTPPIIEACLTVGAADSAQGLRLAAFLRELPSAQIKPNIVPKITDQPWADVVFEHWEKSGASNPVKKAIKRERKKRNGNI